MSRFCNPFESLIACLILLAISFLQSGYDKLFHWKDNVDWLKEHFKKTALKDVVPLALGNILILELIAGVLCAVGCIELYVNNGRTFGFYGAVFILVFVFFCNHKK